MQKLTSEQLAIVQQHVKSGEIFKITAFAGTGKTTTLAAYARIRPSLHFLYLAFNKNMQVQALKKFPNNVTCKTIHSLAWQFLGKRYQDKLGQLKAYQIQDVLNLHSLVEARYVQETLINFLQSKDEQIKTKHIPFIKKPKLDYVDAATCCWKMMQDENDARIPMEHDGYLKLFQIEKHQLPFDFILLDEAQDSNPVTLGILENQKVPVILVGDPHQQLYSFRGAVNAMDTIETNLEADLTGSFRFSDSIAELASTLLAHYKNEDRILRGLGGPTRLKNTKGKFAFLARTNAGLFDQAIQWHQEKRIHYFGGIESLKTDQLLDIWHLWHGSKSVVKDAFIKRFRHFSELEEYSKQTDDKEFSSKIEVVQNYRFELPMLINKIRINAEPKIHDADCLFTTVHKAKGLEFKQVILNDDFVELTKDEELRNATKIPSEEINILYVAITRAKETLELNDDLELFRKIASKPLELKNQPI
ncbi:ATP-dependent helicase [bacterium]|nr:MAG: ATP-dependent helicase [bacterium]